jgi:hypothetical protein
MFRAAVAAEVKEVQFAWWSARVIGCWAMGFPCQDKEQEDYLLTGPPSLILIHIDAMISCKYTNPTLYGEIKTNSCVAFVLHGPRASLR